MPLDLRGLFHGFTSSTPAIKGSARSLAEVHGCVWYVLAVGIEVVLQAVNRLLYFFHHPLLSTT